jgi:hypothetical protein
MFWLVTLPFRLVFGLLAALVMLPLMLLAAPFALLLLPLVLLGWVLRLVFRVVAFVVMLPILLVGGVLAFVVGGIAAAALLLVPLLMVAVIGWFAVRAIRWGIAGAPA